MSTPLNDAVVADQATRSSERSGAPDTRLRGRELIQARVAWVAAVTLIVALFLARLPSYYTALQTVCTSAVCGAVQPTPDSTLALQKLGLSIGAYTTFTLVLTIALAFVCFTLGAVIFWRRSDDWMALLVALAVVVSVTLTETVFAMGMASVWGWVAMVLFVFGNGVYVLVLALYPDGRFVTRWARWVLLCWVIAVPVYFIFMYSIFYPLVWYASLVLLVIAQVYRYRHASSPLQRQQTKWLLYGGSVAVIIAIGLFVPTLLFPALEQAGSFYLLIIQPANLVILFIFPLCLGLAILHYRLWDIDLIINRTLVYGLLTGTIALIYVGLVIGLQYLLRLFSVQASSLVLVGSTLLIAAIFQPLRRRLQRTINRLMYGVRNDPYAVLTRLGQRLEATLAPNTVLPTIVETVAQTLKLAYVAITLTTDERRPIPDQASPRGDVFVPVASYGSPTAHPLRLPLIYQTETLGYLLIGPRPGETLTSANHKLLADLSRQIGISAHSVQLTAELQQARERLVHTREEERRRLRRDLHDGLGSVLASLNWRAGALRMLLFRDPVAADALVVEQQNTIQAAIGDIRRLVYDLRPPALDELGLIGAIRERAAKQSTPTKYDSVQGLRVDVVAPDHLPALPAAVEVAAYRIVQEALTNVVCHAQAHLCRICLSCENDLLHVEVTDDGIGLPESYRAGVGLLSMRERAAELGGTCEIAPMPEGGTCVPVCLYSIMTSNSEEGEGPWYLCSS
jgi:signal transduction histidine kinase